MDKAHTVRLHAPDREALVAHFIALDAEDRRLRFGTHASDEVIRAYVARLDFARDRLFAVHDERLRIVAVVHVAMGEGSAELGLSVHSRWRGRGVGATLFERAMLHLRNRGVKKVYVYCLAENEAMKHLARKNNMRLAFDGGESDAHLELRPSNPALVYAEWIEDQCGETLRAVRHGARGARAAFRR